MLPYGNYGAAVLYRQPLFNGIVMRVSLGEVVSVIALSLDGSVSCIKAWSVLSGTPFTPGFYIAGAIFSLLICSLVLLAFASVRAWTRVR
jgi:hypothetical protein